MRPNNNLFYFGFQPFDKPDADIQPKRRTQMRFCDAVALFFLVCQGFKIFRF